MTQPSIVPGRIPHEQRAAILQQVIVDMAARGWRVEAAAGYRAVFVGGAPVNHAVHALVTIFLCGLWAPIWAFIAATGGIKRRDVYIDDYGNVIGV